MLHSLTALTKKKKNTKADNAEDMEVVILMYNLIEYSGIIQRHLEVCGNIIEMNCMTLL